MFALNELIVDWALHEPIVDGGWQGTNNLILAYRLEGGMNCIPRKKKNFGLGNDFEASFS
jgi:hypothetical protein